MVRIRLRRMGAKKKPTYRIVVTHKQAPRDGRFIEVIGTYNPHTEPEDVKVESDRVRHWLSVGAQPSESVERILRRLELVDEKGKLIQTDAEVEAGEEPETAPAETQTEAAVA